MLGYGPINLVWYNLARIENKPFLARVFSPTLKHSVGHEKVGDNLMPKLEPTESRPYYREKVMHT